MNTTGMTPFSRADLRQIINDDKDGEIPAWHRPGLFAALAAEVERLGDAHEAAVALRWRAENRVQESERRAVRAETKTRAAVAEVEILQEQVDRLEGELADRSCNERALWKLDGFEGRP